MDNENDVIVITKYNTFCWRITLTSGNMTKCIEMESLCHITL